MRRMLLALTALSALALPAGQVTARPNWLAAVAVTDAGSHLLGNPAASVRIVEYLSYTCPHCAHFHRDAEPLLRMGYVQQGKVAVEVRPLVRDPVDLTVALIASCGDKSRFVRNHDLFMRSQDRWLKAASEASASQQQRWSNGPMVDRLRSIAADLGFYTMMEPRGYNRVAIDHCLADQGAIQRLTALRQSALDAGVRGTPSFSVNGELMDDVHDWPGLDAAIRARL